jgi:hypothetical protein
LVSGARSDQRNPAEPFRSGSHATDFARLPVFTCVLVYKVYHIMGQVANKIV